MTDDLSSQWQYFLKNLGEWHGSFTQFSSQGEQLQDTPSVLSLVGSEGNQKVSLALRYLPRDRPSRQINLEFFENIELPNKLLLFEDGSFSQGSSQWRSGFPLTGEFGVIAGERRLRGVIQFDRYNQWDRFTLIREQLAGNERAERPQLTVEQLLGEWRGEAQTIYPNFSTSDIYETHLAIARTANNRLSQTLSFGRGENRQTLSSTAKIEGSRLVFDESPLPMQILLLPGGASANGPLEIQPGCPFFLEMGWLLSPQQRQRLIRSYNAQGKWVSLTLVNETKS